MKTDADPLAALSNAELIGLIKEGNNRAFDTLMLRYTPAHAKYLAILLHDNEELVKDAFQTAWFNILVEFRKGHYHENGQFEKWMNKIVYNAAMKMLRTEKHHAHEKEETGEEPCETLPEGMDDAQLKAYYVFRRMHHTMKRVVVLYAVQEMTCKEIGIKMHLATNSVTKILSRAYVMMNKAAGNMRPKKNFQTNAVKKGVTGLVG